MAFLSYLQETRDILFKQDKPLRAEAALRSYLKRPFESPEERRAVYELMGLILRKQGRYEDALRMYEKCDDHYQAGYCALMRGDLRRVQGFWQQVLVKQTSHWCLTLYGLATRQLQTCPTLLQIRHYLECDIANLVAANRTDYLSNLLIYVDFLSQINLETPKFVGRSLLNAGMVDEAGRYLIQGQRLLPKDPEIYYHLGQYAVQRGEMEKARTLLQQCLMIAPTYSPAAELLEIVRGHL